MDKQELIQKAVIDLCGELPPPPYSKRNHKNGWYLLGGGKVLTHKNIPVWIDTDEFKEAAKNYNFINSVYDTGREIAILDDWYDYEQQKAVTMPPRNTRCQVEIGASWQDGLLIASHGNLGWFASDFGGYMMLGA